MYGNSHFNYSNLCKDTYFNYILMLTEFLSVVVSYICMETLLSLTHHCISQPVDSVYDNN